MAYALGFCCRTGSAAAIAVAPDSGFAGRWAVDLSAQPCCYATWSYHRAVALLACRAEPAVRRVMSVG